MRIIRTQKFEKMFEKLSVSVQNTYRKQEILLKENPRDVRLHLKKLRGINNTYSFRITRTYRALFVWEDNIVWLFAIGNRKDVYR